MNKIPSKLKLENGKVFHGFQFGAQNSAVGEVVFNTAMTGYPESLTDPSYKSQILVCAYPLIGNYGVPSNEINKNIERFFESNQIQVSGLVISYESAKYAHWNAVESLSHWLKRNDIPGLFGVDTREIIKTIRNQGTMLGSIGPDDLELKLPAQQLVSIVSTKEPKVYNEGGHFKVGLIDCGVKHNIVRCLVDRDCEVHLLPHDYDFNNKGFDGIFLSNGPGNPEDCADTVRHLSIGLEESQQPIYGICLGSQLMALAAGGKTYKLKFGHRGHNQPVMNLQTKKCYITSQNHGYAVDEKSLPEDWEMNYMNLNDKSCEGVRHKSRPFVATQFHPEAYGGPTDTNFVFDDFINEMKNFNNQ